VRPVESTIDLAGQSIEAVFVPLENADARPTDRFAAIIGGTNVELTLPRPARSYFHHGWQSWSLASWNEIGTRLPVQKPRILHPMQTDPVHAGETSTCGAWMGAVRFEDENVLLLGALDTDARVALTHGVLFGRCEAAEVPRWLVAYGQEDVVFGAYANALGDTLGRAPGKPAGLVWCSWYSFYKGISESTIAKVVDEMGDLPIDTVQIDDGWQKAVGDWTENEKFPSGLASLAKRIRDSGRTAGLWLAPLIAEASSDLVREHPDWVLRDEKGRPVSAGFNWGDQLYALDTTYPGVSEWLATLMRTVRTWGYDYLKLDFLYGGALAGKRHRDIPREAAYREALTVIRQAMGDAYFVTCGAPILPSLGLCDAIRIGPDVAAHWESSRDERQLANPAIPGTRSAVRTSIHRLWLKPIVGVDPDVVYFSSEDNTLSAEQRLMNLALAQICGFYATSDLPAQLHAAGPRVKDAFAVRDVRKTGPYAWSIDGETVDFTAALGPPGPRTIGDRLLRPIVSWFGSRRFVLRAIDRHDRKWEARRAESV